MDSTDRSEHEDNYENLPGRQAVKKIKEMMELAQNCLFCSAIALDLRITVSQVTSGENWMFELPARRRTWSPVRHSL